MSDEQNKPESSVLTGHVYIGPLKVPTKIVAIAFEKGAIFVVLCVLMWAHLVETPKRLERIETRNDERFAEFNKRADARLERATAAFDAVSERQQNLIEKLLEHKRVSLDKTPNGLVMTQDSNGEVIWTENEDKKEKKL